MNVCKLTIVIGILITILVTILYSGLRYINHDILRRSNTSTTRVFVQHRQFFLPIRHVSLNDIYRNDLKYSHEYSIEFEDEKTFDLINTPGCRIPLVRMNYSRPKLKRKNNTRTCGKRVIYLKKVDKDKIKVTINDHLMKKFLKKNSSFYCCVRFFEKEQKRDRATKLRYTSCKTIQDGNIFNLETDFINVQCVQNNNNNSSKIIYNDVYAFTKKKIINREHIKECGNKYNVLMVGMDSMSILRLMQTMPRTTSYLMNNSWLAFRGYNKIGDNTLPNLLASFTGLDINVITKKCLNKMDHCKNLFIWSLFKDAGYVTAYGEDYIRLPDTFSREYAFRSQPTDHYMKTFFLNGENEVFNKSLLCAGKISSGQHILDYALDFAVTYKSNNFFGFFWLNCFSHNENNEPQDADKIVENFFNRLFYTGIFDNTFLIFFSDHGIRFGELRMDVASYYDNRIPFLFIWPPTSFRSKYPKKVQALTKNQFKLITPFDLYNTLFEIYHMSSCGSFTDKANKEKESKSQSLFSSVSANRTCSDAGIHDKWCSCHKLFPLEVNNVEGSKSIEYVVNVIQNKVRSIQTTACMKCAQLTLKNVTRIHYYYNNIKLYYVVAFEMEPENVFYEATILKHGNDLKLVGPINIISAYRGMGKCTVNTKDRLFCVCQNISSTLCKNNFSLKKMILK